MTVSRYGLLILLDFVQVSGGSLRSIMSLCVCSACYKMVLPLAIQMIGSRFGTPIDCFETFDIFQDWLLSLPSVFE